MKRRDAARAWFAALASDRLPDASTFLRGLSIGALVGAAIAGSAIWERRVRRLAKASDRGPGADRDGAQEARDGA